MLLTASASHDYVSYRAHETEFGQLTPESTSMAQTPGRTKRYSVLLWQGGRFPGQRTPGDSHHMHVNTLYGVVSKVAAA